jgi:hypothetical protein
MLTVSDVQALIVITLGDAFVLNRRVRQQVPKPHQLSLGHYSKPATSRPRLHPRLG